LSPETTTTTARRRLIATGGALALLAWAAVLLWAFFPGPEPTAARAPDRPAHAGERHHAETVEIFYNFDIFDERRLVGYSENVFAGRVLAKVGDEPVPTTIPGEARPHVQYSVEVLETVKSSGPRPLEAGDEPVVAQEGGIDPKTGRPFAVEAFACGAQADDAPLRPGEEYVFATYYDAEMGWHALSAQPASNVPLEGAAEREALLAAFREAARHQIDPLAEGARPC
jgi:hypothetical protein